MDHILTECEVSGQGPIWDFIAELFKKSNLTFTKPSLGDVLGCTLAGREDERNAGERRFKAIVILEAAYTIWKARCEWRISREADPDHTLTKGEMISRMKAALARKIKLDCLATDAERYGNRAAKTDLVRSTWEYLCPTNLTPTKAWRSITAVLVGIG